ncbi:hypothetical protein DRO54_02045 [Candidatus Bathyarchaeota archaeon]|nr:MAG: hypothetical protein DRO54_02045 [Candidatus Bathyarchaeota archaeon]
MSEKKGFIEGEPVDFEVEKEVWNVYKIKDEKPVILKGKVVVVKLLKTNQYNPITGEPIYHVGYQNIFVTFAPPELKGKPSPPFSDQERLASIIKEVDFETISEDWNIYKLKDGTTCRVKLVVTGVQRTKLYAADGDPIYNINSQIVGRFIVPPELKKTVKSEIEKGHLTFQ